MKTKNKSKIPTLTYTAQRYKLCLIDTWNFILKVGSQIDLF